jgi:hypothetical protein
MQAIANRIEWRDEVFAPLTLLRRAPLVAFSALAYTAAGVVSSFDFGKTQLDELRVLAEGVKAVAAAFTSGDWWQPDYCCHITGEHTMAHGSEVMLELRDRLAGSPDCSDFLDGFIATAPVHLADDGQLNPEARARTILAAKFWNGRVHQSSVRPREWEANDAFPWRGTEPHVFPVPFAAKEGMFQMVDGLREERHFGCGAHGAVYPVLPVLSWDLTVLAAAVLVETRESVEKPQPLEPKTASAVEATFKNLLLARVVQVLLLQAGSKARVGGDDMVEEVQGGGLVQQHFLLLSALLGKSTPGGMSEAELEAALSEQLLQFLKIVALLCRVCPPAGAIAELASSGSFALNDDVLDVEETAEILDVMGISSISSFLREEDNWSRAMTWAKELGEMERFQSAVAQRVVEEVESDDEPEPDEVAADAVVAEEDVAVMAEDEVSSFAAGEGVTTPVAGAAAAAAAAAAVAAGGGTGGGNSRLPQREPRSALHEQNANVGLVPPLGAASTWHSQSGFAICDMAPPNPSLASTSHSLLPGLRDVTFLSGTPAGIDCPDPFISLPRNYIDLYHQASSAMKRAGGVGGGPGADDRDDDGVAICLLTGTVLPTSKKNREAERGFPVRSTPPCNPEPRQPPALTPSPFASLANTGPLHRIREGAQ